MPNSHHCRQEKALVPFLLSLIQVHNYCVNAAEFHCAVNLKYMNAQRVQQRPRLLAIYHLFSCFQIKNVMQGLTCIWKKKSCGLQLCGEEAVGKRVRVSEVGSSAPTVTSWHFSRRSWRRWWSGRFLSAEGLWHSSAQPPAGSVCPGDGVEKMQTILDLYREMRTRAFMIEHTDKSTTRHIAQLNFSSGHFYPLDQILEKMMVLFQFIQTKGIKLSQNVTTLLLLCWRWTIMNSSM